jgi:hypothetical protein
MTVKLPWTDRRSRSLPRIGRPNVNLPNVDLSNVQVPRPSLPRVPRVDLPHVDLPRVDLSRIDVPNVDLPKVDLPHVELPDVDLGGVGRAVSDAISGIAETLSGTLSDTGDRARDAVASVAASLPADLPLVSRLRPKPRNTMRPRIIAVAAVSAIAAAAASFYLLFASGSGAKRRAALRRRLQGTPRAAQRGIGVAVESARQVGDRAAELVRVPIDTARDIVGSRTGADGSADSGDGMPGMVAGDVFAVDEAEVMAANPSVDAPVDMTAVAIDTEGAEGGYTDADAAASIYGEPTILTDDAIVESSEFAEAGAGSDHQNT